MSDDRLFLACAPDAASRLAIRRACDEALAELPGRRVPPSAWHWTLRFLGETSPAARRALEAEIDALPLPPAFPARLGGLGAFPRASRGAVLWLGLAEGDRSMATLAALLDEAAAAAGLGRDPRRFHAHLTLARLRPPADLRPWIRALPALDRPLRVDGFALYRSELRPEGARYQALRRWRLPGARRGTHEDDGRAARTDRG